MQTLSRKQEMQIFNLKWLLFPYRDGQTVQVSRNSDQKCELYRVNKEKKTNGWMDGQTDGLRKPRHDISSAGFLGFFGLVE